nr:hypothetical protein [Bacillus nitratireducens]
MGERKTLGEVFSAVKSGTKGTDDIGTPPRYGKRRILKELYDELRDGTPIAKLREKVNEGIEDKIGTPDPALPGKYITGRLQANHIVSMKNMAKTLKSCGFGKTSLDMSMILFDEIIQMLDCAMNGMLIKALLSQFIERAK